MKAIECRSRYLPGNAYGYSTGWLLLLSLRNAILTHTELQITATPKNKLDNLVATLIRFHSVLREESSESVVKLLQALDRVFKCNLLQSLSVKPLGGRDHPLTDATIIRAALQAYHPEGGVLPALRINFNREPDTPYKRLLYPVVAAV